MKNKNSQKEMTNAMNASNKVANEGSRLLDEKCTEEVLTNHSFIRSKRLIVLFAAGLVALVVFVIDSQGVPVSRNKQSASLRAPSLGLERKIDSLHTLFYLNQTKAFNSLQTNGQSSALDFFNYVQGGWDAQINQMFCGIASSAALLNSLRGMIELPIDPTYSPFHWATQNDIVRNDCFKQLWAGVDKEQVIVGPLRLDMASELLGCLLSGQGYDVEGYHMDPDQISEDEARDMIRDAVLNEKARVIINYDRGGIGQGPLGHGHFSPIGGYNHDLDAFLIMDVAKYKYPPVWVPSSNLFSGISTIDHCSKWDHPGCQTDYRGIVIARPSARRT